MNFARLAIFPILATSIFATLVIPTSDANAVPLFRPPPREIALAKKIPQMRQQLKNAIAAHEVRQKDMSLGAQQLLSSLIASKSPDGKAVKVGRHLSIRTPLAPHYLLAALKSKKPNDALKTMVELQNSLGTKKSFSPDEVKKIKTLKIGLDPNSGRSFDAMVKASVAEHHWVSAVHSLRKSTGRLSKLEKAVLTERGLSVDSHDDIALGEGRRAIAVEHNAAADLLIVSEAIGQMRAWGLTKKGRQKRAVKHAKKAVKALVKHREFLAKNPPTAQPSGVLGLGWFSEASKQYSERKRKIDRLRGKFGIDLRIKDKTQKKTFGAYGTSVADFHTMMSELANQIIAADTDTQKK